MNSSARAQGILVCRTQAHSIEHDILLLGADGYLSRYDRFTGNVGRFMLLRIHKWESLKKFQVQIAKDRCNTPVTAIHFSRYCNLSVKVQLASCNLSFGRPGRGRDLLHQIKVVLAV
jgi:hypothetical protein